MNGVFKVPELPSSATKRKFPSAPSDSSKRARVEDVSDPLANLSKIPSRSPNGNQQKSKSIPLAPSIPIGSDDLKGKGKAAAVEEEEEADDGMYGVQDETFEADDGDEEGGRFFGGGTNETQERILDMFAGVADEQSSGLPTIPELRKQIIKFDRIVRKNAEMRSKYVGDPTKYLESEDELDKAFSFLYPLPQNPLLYYPEILKNELLLPALIQLLSHDNTDISLQVISALYEMTDEDVGEDMMEAEEEEGKKEEMGRRLRMIMGDLIEKLLEQSILELLVSNLNRLNEEEEESDRTGVFNILGIFENLLAFLPPLSTQIVEQTELLPWLLSRLTVPTYHTNKQYASEILSILLQEERGVRLKLGEMGGVDPLLQAVSVYRDKDPGDTEELEYMENLFNALCSILNEPELKYAFSALEGVELMALIMKEKSVARTRAIKVMAYATQTEDGKVCCEHFVEALGLKSLFAAFMGKGGPKKNKTSAAFATPPLEDEEHVLSILASLFTSLDSETPARIRTLAKFVENDYEKVDRLLEMREAAEGRLSRTNREVEIEKQIMAEDGETPAEEELDDWYLRRMNAGLAHLQNIDYVLAWVIMEDDGAQNHATMLLTRQGKSFSNTASVLKELQNTIASDAEVEDGEGSQADAVPDKVMILDALVAFCEKL